MCKTTTVHFQYPAHLEKNPNFLKKPTNQTIKLPIDHSYFSIVVVSERKYHLVSLTLLQEIPLAGHLGHNEPMGKGSAPRGFYSRTAAQPTESMG